MTDAAVTLELSDRMPFFFIKGDLSEPVIDALDGEMSYEVPDAEYTDAWKNGEWDGYERLLRLSNNDDYYFPIGLLSTATDVFDAYGISYDVEGLSRPGRGEEDFSWDTPMTLRDYQEDAVNEALRRGSGVVVMPTGAGKTVVGVRLIHELQRPALVLVHRSEIADQWVEELEDILGVDVARYYGGDKENGDVQVALYQSLYDDELGSVRSDARTDHDVVLFDEAHTVGADTFSNVAMNVTAPYRYGFSATPTREDNATLRVIGGTGPFISNLSVENLIDDGYLAEPEWRIYESPPAGGMYGDWQGEYKGEIVRNEERNEMIRNAVASLEKPVMVTVERIGHGERLEELIEGAEFVHGSDSEREEKIERFRDGATEVLVATRGLVGEGFNVPEIRSFVVAGGLKSSTSTLQQVGRALRPGEDGKATVVDFIDKGEWVGSHSEERIRTYQDYYGSHGP